MISSRSLLSVLGVVLLSVVGAHAALTELEDYDAALKQAAKENRPVLLDFTGSDWCPPCKMMAKEVFASDEFAAFAEKNLIVVKLDFSPSGAKPGKFQQQHNELAERYKIEGFPTFILLDSKGKQLASEVGYQPGGPKAFISWIQKAQK